MKYLYTLPASIIILGIIIALITLLLQVVNASIYILIKPKRKNKIISYIYIVNLIIYFIIVCGVLASVQRHLTEGTIYFNYYYTYSKRKW